MGERNERLMYILIAVVAALFFMRFLPFLRYAIFILLGLALVGIPIYWLVQRWQQGKRAEQLASSVEGRAAMQLERLGSLSAKNSDELDLINTSIKDIATQQAEKLSESNRKELNRLLQEYKQERALRITKQRFLDASQEKLQNIIKNKQLADELARKKAELDAMREEQFEELAELENIQYDIETDVFYLDAIDELSEKMLLKSPSTSADTLKLELEKMTEKLKSY
jgi:ABC-type multidrug transport system fused ATPase/permease subunit